MGPSGLRCPGVSDRSLMMGLSEGVSLTGYLRHSGVSKRCPRVSQESAPTLRSLGTRFGHSGAQGLTGAADTPWDTPSVGDRKST